jgi:hypothetical protein
MVGACAGKRSHQIRTAIYSGQAAPPLRVTDPNRPCCIRSSSGTIRSLSISWPASGAPTTSELQGLVQQISERLGRHLERRGLLVRDAQSSYLELGSPDAGEAEENALSDLQGHSITYRIAVGAQNGRKAMIL